MSERLLKKILNQKKTLSDFSSYDENSKEQLSSVLPQDANDSRNKYISGKGLDTIEEEIEDDTDEENKESVTKTSSMFSRNRKKVFTYFNQESKLLGKIVSVDKEEKIFTALVNNPASDITREIQFSFDDVTPSEYHKIKVDRRVIFTYGQQYENGTRYNLSKLYLRDTPIWSKRELDKRKQKMLQLVEGIYDEDASD